MQHGLHDGRQSALAGVSLTRHSEPGCGKLVELLAMITVGEKLAGFEVVSPLKAGGMATLYLGRRSGAGGFSRHVAIKVIHSHLANDQNFVRMFLDEARLCARIDHPNVVHVEELGELNGHYFLVMEYVHGCSLWQLASRLAALGRRLTPEIVGFIGMRVASGLHAAHELRGENGQSLGVVHRDVSPQNILLAYKGYVKLIDFGIAKAAGRSHQTRAGSLKGKFAYMSPEQALGRVVDRRTDVYALGIVLWELLTMRTLFTAENDMLLLDAVRKPVIPRPSTIVPNIPVPLENVIMSALAREPQDRPKTARDFQQDLAAAIPGALVLDAPHLADLLDTVMGEEIEKESAKLPESFSTANRDPGDLGPRTGEQVLRSYTVSLPPELSGKPEGDEGSEYASPPRDARYASTIVLDDYVPPSDPDAKVRQEQGPISTGSSVGAGNTRVFAGWGRMVRRVAVGVAPIIVVAGAWLALRVNDQQELPRVAQEPAGVSAARPEKSAAPPVVIPEQKPVEVEPIRLLPQTNAARDAGIADPEGADDRPSKIARDRARVRRQTTKQEAVPQQRDVTPSKARKARSRNVDGVPILDETPF